MAIFAKEAGMAENNKYFAVDDRPVRALMAAMLTQAIKDMFNTKEPYLQARAIFYLQGGEKLGCLTDKEYPLSARRCCEVLNIDHATLLEKLGIPALIQQKRKTTKTAPGDYEAIFHPKKRAGRSISGEYFHGKFKGLSKREKQVLSLIRKKKTFREIAAEIGITPSAVQTYAERIRKKKNTPTAKKVVCIT